MSDKKSFIVFTDRLNELEMLSDEDCGKMFKAIINYVDTGKEIMTDSLPMKMLFSVFKSQIDENCAKYKKKKERNAEYYRKYKTQQQNSVNSALSENSENSASDTGTVTDTVTVTGTVTVTDTVTDTGINNINVINNKNKSIESVGGQKSTPNPKKEFKRPSLDEVKAYCKERNSSIEPESFFDYYESNGWKVGKNPMKDWKATLRRWERTQFDNKSNNNGSSEPELTKGEDGFYYDKNGDRYI